MVSSASLTIRDRGLGLARTLALPLAIIGCSSIGTAESPTLVSSEEDLVDAFGYGPAVSLCAKVMREAGGPLLFCRVTTGTVGQTGAYHQRGAGSAAAGTLSAAGGNTSTAIPALTGTPSTSYALKIVVTTAGANIAAVPVVKISLDGGLTFLATGAVAVSASPQAIGDTGLSLAWTDGTFVLAESWTASGAACPTDADATGASALTISGTPVDAFDVVVEVTRSAATAGDGTGAVRYSLDAGENFSEEMPVPASREVSLGDSGLAITFSAASLVDGDLYYFKTAAPVFTAAELEDALQALEEVTTPDHEGVVIAGAIDATYFDEIKASHDRLIAASRPRWFLAHARDQGASTWGETASAWASALLAATPGFSGSNAKFVAVAAGACDVVDGLHGDATLRRSVAFPIAARLAAIDVSEHPGRVRSGPLALEALHHDMASSSLQALDAAGFIGAQSIQGVDGYYATSATRAAAGSDFSAIMRVRVACFAARAALARMVEECNESILVNNDGTIRADVADGLDASVTSYMTRELGRRVSSVSVTVDRTADLVSDEVLPFRVRMVPLGYAKSISIDLGYTLARSN